MLTKKRITIASVAAATAAGLALTATSAGAQESDITVSPTEAAPGESFTVSGPPCDALLEPTSVVVNLFDTRASASTQDAGQSWTLTLTVPEETPTDGEYVVIAQCFNVLGVPVQELGRVPFTVTEPPPPTTTTSTPEETTTTAPGTPPTSEPGGDGGGTGGDGGGDDNGTAGGPDAGSPTDPDEGSTSAAGQSATVPDGPETEDSEPATPVNGEPNYTG